MAAATGETLREMAFRGTSRFASSASRRRRGSGRDPTLQSESHPQLDPLQGLLGFIDHTSGIASLKIDKKKTTGEADRIE